MPTPMPGELLVEVRAAGVNPVDWKIRSGMFGNASEGDLPAVLGSEVSGVVRGVGKDVARGTRLIEQAAEANLREAQFELGLMYHDGTAVTKSDRHYAYAVGTQYGYPNRTTLKRSLQQLTGSGVHLPATA